MTESFEPSRQTPQPHPMERESISEMTIATASAAPNGVTVAIPKRPAKYSRLRLRLTRGFVVCVLLTLALGVTNWSFGHPLVEQSLFLTGITLAGFGAAGRAWATSYISGLKLKELVTSGPYSLCRNPLYFFSFILAIGFGFCTKTLTIPFLIAVVMAILYHFQIKREERILSQQFGSKYQDYLATVPRFIPRLKNYHEVETIHISTKPLRKGMFGIAFLLILIGVLELMRGLHEADFLPKLFHIY
jgi:protein-S-isoprenylcysteine O-methyltransferase Ste14